MSKSAFIISPFPQTYSLSHQYLKYYRMTPLFTKFTKFSNSKNRVLQLFPFFTSTISKSPDSVHSPPKCLWAHSFLFQGCGYKRTSSLTWGFLTRVSQGQRAGLFMHLECRTVLGPQNVFSEHLLKTNRWMLNEWPPTAIADLVSPLPFCMRTAFHSPLHCKYCTNILLQEKLT